MLTPAAALTFPWSDTSGSVHSQFKLCQRLPCAWWSEVFSAGEINLYVFQLAGFSLAGSLSAVPHTRNLQELAI